MKEAERILSKVEFHYTPKNASWLNAAEIKINVMGAECTGRRIEDKETLAREITAWTKRRNQQKKKIDWRFTHRMPIGSGPNITYNVMTPGFYFLYLSISSPSLMFL